MGLSSDAIAWKVKDLEQRLTALEESASLVEFGRRRRF